MQFGVTTFDYNARYYSSLSSLPSAFNRTILLSDYDPFIWNLRSRQKISTFYNSVGFVAINKI